MTREEAHKLVDHLFDNANGYEQELAAIDGQPDEPKAKPAITAGKRVVRTKSTGDRVYLIDETAKTKAWVTSPEILAKLGFELSDVEDVEDSTLLGYAMTASVYRVED
jgi:hypothetical protein